MIPYKSTFKDVVPAPIFNSNRKILQKERAVDRRHEINFSEFFDTRMRQKSTFLSITLFVFVLTGKFSLAETLLYYVLPWVILSL